jgi:hypothetical protein
MIWSVQFPCFQKYCFSRTDIFSQNIKSENYTWKPSTLREVISTSIGLNELIIFKFFYNMLSFKSGQYVNIAVTNSTPINIRKAVSSKMVIIMWSGRVRKWRKITNRWKYRNILVKVKRIETVWIGYLIWRNDFLKNIIEGNIEGCVEVRVRRGRIRTQLLDDWKKTRVYWILKETSIILYPSIHDKSRNI